MCLWIIFHWLGSSALYYTAYSNVSTFEGLKLVLFNTFKHYKAGKAILSSLSFNKYI